MAVYVPDQHACRQDPKDPRDVECWVADEYYLTFEGYTVYILMPRIGVVFKAYEFTDRRFGKIARQTYRVLAQPCLAIGLPADCMFPKHWKRMPIDTAACAYEDTVSTSLCHTTMTISYHESSINTRLEMEIHFEMYARDYEYADRKWSRWLR